MNGLVCGPVAGWKRMAGLCREFDIPARYKDSGLEGLTGRSRRPYRHAKRLPSRTESLISTLPRRSSPPQPLRQPG